MLKFQVTEDCNWLRLVSYDDEIEVKQLRLSLTRFVKNYFFNPKYKKKDSNGKPIWDGKICFLVKDSFIQIGLWGEVVRACENHSIPIEIDRLDLVIDRTMTLDAFRAWALNFFKDGVGGDKDMMPRDYQMESAFLIVKHRFSAQELATNAGKTLIVFMAVAYMLEHKLIEKFMMIVPNTNLVIQAVEDFQVYGASRVNMQFQMLYSGTERRSDANVVVGTYQSLIKCTPEYHAQFQAICVDEAHTSDSMSIKKILMQCTSSKYRFGLSGTIPDHQHASYFTIQAMLGPLVMKVSPDFLFKNSYATPVEIKIVRMDYLPEEAKEKLNKLRTVHTDMDGKDIYQIERKLVVNSRPRLEFITDFMAKSTKNSLVLYQSVEEGYGKQIYDKMREKTSKQLFYIDGNTSPNLREEYKERMRTGEDRMLVASFKTFATGISINNLHNIFMVESYKSEIMIKQSIGRGMRMQDDKDKVVIIDFVDNFTWGGKPNFMMKHSVERIDIYEREGFMYKIFDIKF